jgi:hypothetical protein
MKSIEEIDAQTFIDRVLVWTDNYLRMNELRLLRTDLGFAQGEFSDQFSGTNRLSA